MLQHTSAGPDTDFNRWRSALRNHVHRWRSAHATAPTTCHQPVGTL